MNMTRVLRPAGYPLGVLAILAISLLLETRRAGASDPPDEALAAPRLTPEQINRVRFMELKAAREPDRGPANASVDRIVVDIPPEVVNKFIAWRLGERDFRGENAEKRFRAMTPPQKLAIIAYWVRGRAEEYEYADAVRIRRDPEIIVDFRRRILPTLINGCASSACHGSPDVARVKMRLYNDPRRTEQEVYANFVTLREWTVNHRPLINHDKPEESLLLTYMLPRADTRYPHPDVPGFKPLYQRSGAPGYRTVRDWIAELRKLDPHRGYGFRLYPQPDDLTTAPADAYENQP
jgi:hypothetical protein